MDAIEFVKERHRLCQTYVDCFKCPAHNSNPGGCNFSTTSEYEATEQIRLLEEWSAAHPRKTRQSVFLEQYPEASIGNDGVLRLCPFLIDASYRNNDGSCKSMQRQCSDCRKKYWLQEVE